MKTNPLSVLHLLPTPVRAKLRPYVNGQERPIAILAYHRVMDMPSDPQQLAVRPVHFAQHLEIIRRYARPIPLSNVTMAVTQERTAGPCVAVTFDDGYFDNFEFAKPILDYYGISATVFVVTGEVMAADMRVGRDFWWDELERHILLPRQLPPFLDVEVGLSVLRWWFNDDFSAPDPTWNVTRGPSCTRQAVYVKLIDELSRLSPAVRDTVLARLAVWSGNNRAGRDSCRSMTCAELHKLREDGLVTLGAHTQDHPMLSQLTASHQRAEIEASKLWLERQFGDPVMSFAYPHGTRGAYSRHTAHLVRQVGFEYACSTAARTVSALDDPYELPRLTVRDWGAAEFERRLKGWLRL